MQSLLQLMGLPREFGITVLMLSLALVLVPYLAGSDFGVVKLPVLEDRKRSYLRVLGPVLFVLALLSHAPIIALPRADPKAVAFIPLTASSSEPAVSELAKTLTSLVVRSLSSDRGLKVASTRSAQVAGERDTIDKLASQLKVSWVFEGTLTRTSAGHIKVWLSMVKGADGFAAWNPEFCSKDTDDQALDSLANQISFAIQKRLAEGEAEALTQRLIGEADDAPCYQDGGQSVDLFIFFEEGTAIIARPSYEALRNVATAMKSEQLAKSSFLIEGHVSPSRDAHSDRRLSEARALSTKAALMSLGIDQRRLVSVGRGGTKPLSSDGNAPENRRVTFSLLR